MCTPFGRWSVGREFNRRLKARFEVVGVATAFSALRLLPPESGPEEAGTGEAGASEAGAAVVEHCDTHSPRQSAASPRRDDI